MLISVTPSFRSEWDSHRNKYGEDLVYVALGDYAEKLLQLQQARYQDELDSIANVIEHILVEGSSKHARSLLLACWKRSKTSALTAKSTLNSLPDISARVIEPVELLNDFWGKKVNLDNDKML